MSLMLPVPLWYCCLPVYTTKGVSCHPPTPTHHGETLVSTGPRSRLCFEQLHKHAVGSSLRSQYLFVAWNEYGSY